MAEIFISYARPDRDYARRLANYLEDHGLSVWWDMNLEPGQVFRQEIERRIGEARHVIVLWSETSVKSHFVLDEAGDAASQNKLVPVRIDGCKLPYGFGQHHTHAVSNWPGDLAPVLAAVRGSKPVRYSALTPAETAEEFFNSGLEDHAAQDYEHAISEYSQAIRLRTDYADAYRMRASAYMAKRDSDRALLDLNQALHLNQKDEESYSERGSIYASKGNYVSVIDNCNHAIRLNPNGARYYYGRGEVYYSKGDYARAIIDYDQSLKVDPKNVLAAVGKRNAEMELAGAAKKAEMELTKAPKKKGWF